MKKWISVILSAILSLGVLFSFSGCKEEVEVGPIPNGKYAGLDGEYVRMKNYEGDLYWKIEGNNVEQWVSNSLDYKAKIVKKDGKMYFEGYKWVDPLSSFLNCQEVVVGREKTYEVFYDAEKKTITIDYYTSQDT